MAARHSKNMFKNNTTTRPLSAFALRDRLTPSPLPIPPLSPTLPQLYPQPPHSPPSPLALTPVFSPLCGFSGRIVTTVVRTASELSDLQVSLLEDVLALIKQERNPVVDGGHDMYDAAKRGSWRSPNSYEGALFNEVVDGVKSIRSGLPPAPDVAGPVSASARARTELEAANRVAEALKREMQDRDRADVCAVTVTIKGGDDAMQDKAQRQSLQSSILSEVSKALGVMPKRLEVVGMHRADAKGQLSQGDYDLDLFVLPCAVDAPPTEAPARKIAEQVVFQASNPGSPLREMSTGSRMTRGEHRSTYEYVHRLRHTVRILQDEVRRCQARHATDDRGALLPCVSASFVASSGVGSALRPGLGWSSAHTESYGVL